MRSSAGTRLLRLLGVLASIGGLLAWVGLAWRALSDLEAVTADSPEGARLMTWALVGTLAMILGTVLLHLAANADESSERADAKEPTAPR